MQLWGNDTSFLISIFSCDGRKASIWSTELHVRHYLCTSRKDDYYFDCSGNQTWISCAPSAFSYQVYLDSHVLMQKQSAPARFWHWNDQTAVYFLFLKRPLFMTYTKVSFYIYTLAMQSSFIQTYFHTQQCFPHADFAVAGQPRIIGIFLSV